MGRRIKVAEGGAGHHAGRILDSKGHDDGIHDMAGHVAKGAGTEIIEAAPVPGGVGRIVWPHLGRADEEIPVKGLGDLYAALGLHESLWPDRTVSPRMHLVHVSDHAGPDPLGELAAVIEGIALVAHLGGHLVFLGQFGQQSGLIDRMRQGFLDIDMLAQSHGVGGDDGMGVVRCGHNDGVDVLAHLVEHHPPVLETLC